MFVDHLRHRVAKQHNVLVKRLDLTLQLDAVDKVDGNRNMLTSQRVEKWILQELTFVIAHDIFRVQRVNKLLPYHEALDF